MNDPLLTIQLAIQARLKSDEWFKNIPVIAQDKGDITNQVEIGVSKIGAAVIILTPSADVTHPNIPGPYLGDVTIIVACVENVTINRSNNGSKKNAITTAQIALGLLVPPWIGSYRDESTATDRPIGPLAPGRPTLRMEVDPEDPDLLAYHVTLTTQVGLQVTHTPL